MCYEYMIKIFAAVSFLSIYIVPFINQNRLNQEKRYNAAPKTYSYFSYKIESIGFKQRLIKTK